MKVISLHQHREKRIEQKAFTAWEKRFDRPFALNTRLPDLPPEVLYRLAGLDEEAENGLGELVEGVTVAIGRHKTTNPMVDLDIQLFLLDQMRYEINHRLGWIGVFPTQKLALWHIAHNFSKTRALCQGWCPKLLKAHPAYEESLLLYDRDREALVRRMLPAALEAFARRMEVCAIT